MCLRRGGADQKQNKQITSSWPGVSFLAARAGYSILYFIK